MDDLNQLQAKMRKIIDREEILECLRRYARGMDRQDYDMVRSAYHEDAIDLHGSRAATVNEFLDWVFRYHADQRLHQHYMTNHSVEIDGDTAHSETYYQFVASYPDPERNLFVAGGRYIDRLERRDGRWGIVVRICSAEWQTELPMTRRRGLAVDSSGLFESLVVARDRTDLSYNRPLTACRNSRR